MLSFTPVGNGILTGLAGGGVYFSNDQGRNWTARNNGLTNQQINTLASGGAAVYAGTNGGVFRSGDGGANSWNRFERFHCRSGEAVENAEADYA